MTDICAEALELAGVDFMTVSPAVWEELNDAATLQGYNDGFTAASGESGLQQSLSPEVSSTCALRFLWLLFELSMSRLACLSMLCSETISVNNADGSSVPIRGE